MGGLPAKQESQQILAEGHQAMPGLGVQHVGEVPLVQDGHLGALLAVARQGAEIEPEVTPVELLQRQLQGIEQADRLAVAISGPLPQQIGQQGGVMAQTALPLLALLAPLHRICLLQPAEPEQGAEHPGPGRRLLPLPLAKRPQQPLGQGLLIPLLRQLLQRRPVSGYLAAKGAAEPLPFLGASLDLARERRGAGGDQRCQRPALVRLCVKQGLQGEVLEQQGLPGGAGACQQAGSIGEIQEAQEFGTLVIGRDLPRVSQTELAHHLLCPLQARDRGDAGPLRHGALPRTHRQDQGQGSLCRQTPLLLRSLTDKPPLLQLIEGVEQRTPGCARGIEGVLQVTSAGGALQLQLAQQGMAI